MFNNTSASKTKVIPEILENLIPEGAKKFEKKTEEVPEASKKSPRKIPRPKMRPTKSRVGLQNGPWDPRGAPEAQEAILGCSKAFFESPQGTPLAKQWRRANSVI